MDSLLLDKQDDGLISDIVETQLTSYMGFKYPTNVSPFLGFPSAHSMH